MFLFRPFFAGYDNGGELPRLDDECIKNVIDSRKLPNNIFLKRFQLHCSAPFLHMLNFKPPLGSLSVMLREYFGK